MKVKLFTHTDLDGVSCAIVAYMTFGKDNVDVTYCDYHNVNDKIYEFLSEDNSLHDKVFITDISVNEDVAKAIERLHVANPNIFMLLDHHETANWLNQYDWARVVQKHNDGANTSGTSMLFKYLLSGGYMEPYIESKLDSFVETVRRYDTWDWHNIYNDTFPKEVNNLFFLYGRDRFIDKAINIMNTWGHFALDESDELILQIEQDRIQKEIRKSINNTTIQNIGKYKAGITFGDNYSSETCHALLDAYPEIDIAVMIDLKSMKVSYRTDREGVDVGQIAKHFGGGGRKQTAGSQIEDEIINNIVKCILN